MTPTEADGRLEAALGDLGQAVAGFSFSLPGWPHEEWASRQDALSADIERCESDLSGDRTRRVVVAIIGATGSGKSTLLNSLAESVVSSTGTLRPTTGAPIVWVQYDLAPILTGVGATYIESSDSLLRGVTIIDAPDIDSTVEAHRLVASGIMESADLCLFVTSARRYADEAVWSMLRIARRRRLPLYFVLNRLPEDGVDEILADYAANLRRNGLLLLAEDPRMLLVLEQRIDPDQERLPPTAVRPLRQFLASLSDPRRREAMIRKACLGRAVALAGSARLLAEASTEEASAATKLARAAEAAFEVAGTELTEWLEPRPNLDAEEVASQMVLLAEHAATATRVAWSSVPSGAAMNREPAVVSWDAGDAEERARKVAATWIGAVPEERDVGELAGVLRQEASTFADEARRNAQPAYRAARVRAAADVFEAAARELYA